MVIRANPSVNSTSNNSRAPSATSGQTRGRSHAGMIMEDRSPIGHDPGVEKFEGRRTKDERMTKSEKARCCEAARMDSGFCHWDFFGIWILSFGFPSSFGICHSSFAVLRRDGLHNRRQLNLVSR